VSVPLVVFAVALLQSMSFWLTNSLRMTALIDATGVVLAYTVAWIYSRYAKSAVWWLLPWLLWMPTTLVIKLLALMGKV
jgi:translocator protein